MGRKATSGKVAGTPGMAKSCRGISAGWIFHPMDAMPHGRRAILSKEMESVAQGQRSSSSLTWKRERPSCACVRHRGTMEIHSVEVAGWRAATVWWCRSGTGTRSLASALSRRLSICSAGHSDRMRDGDRVCCPRLREKIASSALAGRQSMTHKRSDGLDPEHTPLDGRFTTALGEPATKKYGTSLVLSSAVEDQPRFFWEAPA